MPTILGVNFGHSFFGGGPGPETLGKEGRAFRHRNLLRIHPTFLRRNVPHRPVDLPLSTRFSAMKEGVSVGGTRQALTGK